MDTKWKEISGTNALPFGTNNEVEIGASMMESKTVLGKVGRQRWPCLVQRGFKLCNSEGICNFRR